MACLFATLNYRENILPNLITQRIERSIDVKFLALEKNQRRGLKDVGALLFKTVASEESVNKDMLLKGSVLAMYST